MVDDSFDSLITPAKIPRFTRGRKFTQKRKKGKEEEKRKKRERKEKKRRRLRDCLPSCPAYIDLDLDLLVH